MKRKRNIADAVITRDYYAVNYDYYGDVVVNRPFEVLTNRQVFNAGGNPVYQIEFNGSNNLIAVADEAGTLTIADVYRTDNNTSLRVEAEGNAVTPVVSTLKWNPDNRRVATGYGDGSLRIWDVNEHKTNNVVTQFRESIKRVDWRDHETNTLVCCSRNEIGVFDFRMRNACSNMINCTQLGCKVSDIAVLNSNYVASCSSNSGRIMLWDLRNTYKLYKKIIPVCAVNCSSDSVVSLCFDPYDPKLLVALEHNRTIEAFHWDGMERVFAIEAHCDVDFHSKICVDSRGFVLVGGAGACANVVGFDNRVIKVIGEEDEDSKENFNSRSCSAVCLWNRVHSLDMCVKIGTGGDDSLVNVWE